MKANGCSYLALLFLFISLESRPADAVSALGRVEPLGGIVTLAGPSGSYGRTAVLAKIQVEEGDWVEAGQTLAILDDFALRKAEVARQTTLVEDVSVRLKRLENLAQTQSTSRAKLDETRYELRALKAGQKVLETRMEMSRVRSPLRAQILKIHAKPGERVGAEGVIELGRTDRMSVIAEVYETDIARVKTGQAAIVRSAALEGELQGTVVKVALQVGRMDVLDTDPVAKTDARVVDVTIELEDGTPLQALTNLQVDVEIQP